MNIKLLFYSKIYISIFIIFSLTYFFLSTNNAFSKNLIIENIERSKKFDDKFNRNEVINEGFNLAFKQLMKKLFNHKIQK